MYLHSSALSLYIQAMMWVSSKERENAVCTSGSRKYRDKYNYNLLILRENPLAADQHQHLYFLHFIHFHTPAHLLHHQADQHPPPTDGGVKPRPSPHTK
ncbi:hypothetical protein BDD12DRAFT_838056 [Trichophaea hybrida]|nr:hypothetical protein BDD12DRAFT_838056 [Trichophaea hybrida]